MALEKEKYWKYLLSQNTKDRVLYVNSKYAECNFDESKFLDYDALVVENCDITGLEAKRTFRNIEKLLRGKQQAFISFHGYNPELTKVLDRNGFKIKNSYWVYRKKNGRTIWLIPLDHPGIFLFSLNTILNIIADRPLVFKKMTMYMLLRARLLKFFIDNCIIAKSVS